MKLRYITLGIVCALSTIINSAYALGSGTGARGNIIFKNGEQLDSVRFEMPNDTDRQVKVTVDGEKMKFDTDSIDCILLWHEKRHDMKYLFRPF